VLRQDLGNERHLVELGLPTDVASAMAARMDSTMKDCILRLYRSALEVGREWAPDLANIASPGLVFWGVADQACPVAFAEGVGGIQIVYLGAVKGLVVGPPDEQWTTSYWSNTQTSPPFELSPKVPSTRRKQCSTGKPHSRTGG
jgi:hypothetical protein